MGLFGPPDVKKMQAKQDVRGLIRALGYKKDAAVRENAVFSLGKTGDARVVRPLMAALKDSDWGVREAAARSLRVIGWRPGMDEIGALYWLYIEEWGKCIEIGALAIPTLLASLKDGKGDVRKKAAYALGRIGDPRAVQPLIVGLGDTEADLRSDAAYALGLIGDARAAEPLIAALKDSKSSVRKQAARALGKIGDARAIHALTAARGDADPDVRSAAMDALTRIPDTGALGPLIAALQGDDADIRKQAAKSLEKIGWQPTPDELGAIYWMVQEKWNKCVEIGSPAVEPLIANLIDWKKNPRPAVADALAQMKAPAVMPLIASLWKSPEMSHAAADVLGRIGAPAVAPLIASLKDSNAQVRERAADALGQIGGSSAVLPLVAAVKDSERTVRSAAIASLGKIGDQRAVAPLASLLEDQALRPAAARALEKMGWRPPRDELGAVYWIALEKWDECVQIGAPAIKPLIASIQSGDVWRSWPAAKALGRIGDPCAIESLVKVFAKDPPETRILADALAGIGARGAQPFVAALKHPDKSMRYWAANALGELGWSPTKDGHGAVFCVFRGHWSRCVEIGVPAVEPLCEALREESAEVRTEAARALGKIGDARAVNSLASTLDDKDENVRCEAANALSKIGKPALETLVTALKSSDWWHPALALGKIGDARAILPLVRAFEYESIRESAVTAVAAFGAAAIAPLIAALSCDGPGEGRPASEALVKIGPPAVLPLCAALKDNRKDRSILAARALGKIGDARGAGPLIAVLKDSDGGRYKAAVAALDEIGWKPRQDEVGATYWSAKDDWSACVQIGAPAVQWLINILLDSKYREQRVGAAGALGGIGDARAVAPAIASLRDKDIEVRNAAAAALDGIRWRPGQDEAGATYWSAKREWRRCVEIGRPAVEWLIAMLSDYVQDVREGAAGALGQIVDARAIEPLINMLCDEKPWSDRSAAAKSLVFMYHSRALSQAQKQVILAQRARITKPRKVWKQFVDDQELGHMWSTHDTGIGVEFPV